MKVSANPPPPTPALTASLPRWTTLWHEVGAQSGPGPWYERLVTAYSASDRHYHNLQHLAECLAELDTVRAQTKQPAWIELALWFHDAVYDARSTTNEEDSAALAIACLDAATVARSVIDAVRQLVLCTKSHEPGADLDGALLIDIDLAILGQRAARFWEYERAIRAEYAWVPAATFAEKRAEILTRFLQRPALYRTDAFRARYETAARTNLRAAISRLQSGAIL